MTTMYPTFEEIKAQFKANSKAKEGSTHKPEIKVSKVTFNEDNPTASAFFMDRLMTKVLFDQLDLPPQIMGDFIKAKNQED